MPDRLPKNLSVQYYKDMNKHIRYMEQTMQKGYQERIIPLILKYQEEARQEAQREIVSNALLGSLSARLAALYTITQAAINNEFTSISLEVQSYFTARTLAATATRFVNRINITDKRNVEKDIEAVAGVSATQIKGLEPLQDKGTEKIVRRAINENVALIQSIPEKYLSDVEKAVYTGLENGTNTADIGKEISDIGGVSERHGKFIARDQLGAVHGNLTKQRQENLGLKKFKWITSQDARVRESHKKLDGRIFEWSKGAQGDNVDPEVKGLVPGQDYNCRCTSSIVDEDVWDLLDRIAEREPMT